MASHMRTLSALIVIATFTFGALPSGHAQSAADKAAAESLFDRGLALMKEGRFEEACQRLEQSQAIERGIGTMLYLAECYEKVGKTASAWALFREAASWAQAEGQVERAEAGRRRAERLEKGLSRLAVQVPAANKVHGLSVRDNGSSVLPSVWGLALPVDPGVHRVEASAPGYLPWSTEVKVGANADSAEVRVPALEKDPNAQVAAAPSAPTPAETASAALEGPAAPEKAAAPAASGMSTQRKVGLSLGSVGLAAIAVGAITGGLAIKNNNDSKDNIDGEICNEKCESLSDKAVKQSTASTVAWSVGGVLLAGGLITYLLGPKHPPRADVGLRLDRQVAAIRVGGAF